MFSGNILSLLHPAEQGVLFLRRHWIVPFQIVLASAVLYLAPTGIWIYSQGYFNKIIETNIGRALLLLLGSVYFLCVTLFLFFALIDYWLDEWSVTTKRILHIEQKGLFYREIAELELSRIQDLTSITRGVFPTLLGYGTINVQTAAESPRFIFRYVPNPEMVRSKIMAILKEARHPEHKAL